MQTSADLQDILKFYMTVIHPTGASLVMAYPFIVQIELCVIHNVVWIPNLLLYAVGLHKSRTSHWKHGFKVYVELLMHN